MTIIGLVDEPAFLEAVTRACAADKSGSLSKLKLENLVKPANLRFTEIELDKFLIHMVKAGQLRSSGGRFWTPRKAEP